MQSLTDPRNNSIACGYGWCLLHILRYANAMSEKYEQFHNNPLQLRETEVKEGYA